MEKRMTFGNWVDRTLLALLASIGLYLASGIDDLNRKMATIMERTSNQQAILTNHESRIEMIERNVKFTARSRE